MLYLNKNWKINLILKICIANISIPLLFLILNQFYVRYFSLTFESTFAHKIITQFDAGVFILFFIFGLLTLAAVYFILRPLFSYIEKQKNYSEARVSALRVPWFLILLHAVLWITGPTVYYWLEDWKPIHGMNYIWALLTDFSTGLVAVVCVILAINNSLAGIKIRLQITDMRRNEQDTFIKYSSYIASGSLLFYAIVHISYISYFYYLYGLNFGKTDLTFVPFILFNIYLFILAGVILYFSRRDYHFQVDLLKIKLDELTSGSNKLSERIIIVNFDEMGEVCMKINLFLNAFTGILQKVKDAGKLLAEAAHSLSGSSGEIAVISNKQAAAVKEVVNSVEETDRFVNDMNKKINEVVCLIREDEMAINKGFSHIQESLRNMNNIKEANNKTILGIRSLGEEIENIWDIVRIISSIADQTKIIAFNAELEASAAGEAGRNFQIVAGEIRRLADKTVTSTREIKAKIDEIQNVSDFLVRSSEEGTSCIREEWELSNNIGKIFDNIRKSTEISTAASRQIIYSVNHVVSASSQILKTLRQINEGIENFVESTRFSSDSAQSLKKMADDLNKIVENYSIK